MADIKITIPDNHVIRVLNAICDQYGYTEKLADGSDNPLSKAQFAKQVVQRFVKEVVMANEATKAANEAHRAKLEAVESEIVLS